MTLLYHPTPLENVSTLHLTLYVLGLNLEKLTLSELITTIKKVKDFTAPEISKRFLELNQTPNPKEKHICMPEFLQTIKNKISLDKLMCCKTRIQVQKLLKTLDQESTLKERVLKPYWNMFTLERSKESWLPIKTDCADLVQKYLSGFSKKRELNSWFSTNFQTMKTFQAPPNLQKTYLQLPQFLSLETTEPDQQITEKSEKKKKKKLTKSTKSKTDQYNAIKFRIYPDTEQRQILNQWFGSSRFIYNKCAHHIKTHYDSTGSFGGSLTIKNLRNNFINNINYPGDQYKWMRDIPYDVRDEAAKDLINNYSSNLKKSKKFYIKFRSKKDHTQSISVLSKHWGHKTGIFSRVFSSDRLKCEKKLPNKLDHTCRLLKTELNKYYLCVPQIINIKNCANSGDLRGCKVINMDENQCPDTNTDADVNTNTVRIISLDPGIRTFQTGYDPDGLILNIAPNDIGSLMRLIKWQRKLQGIISKRLKLSRSIKKLKKALIRSGERIRNLVDDCHKKTALWLCKNYNTILIPRLNFHRFKTASTTRQTRSQLSVWSHCKFVDRLINKSREFSYCKIVEVTEEFTSKTCSCCGKLNEKLGRSKTFECSEGCGSVMDRDANGARGIYLKYLTDLENAKTAKSEPKSNQLKLINN